MKGIDENTRADDDRRFDLLVDGELSEAQRRELLAGLDDEPGGWRTCALAFLETQAWRQDFGSILREPEPQPAATSFAVQPGRSWLGRNRGTLMAMAASFVVALLLGLQWREAFRSTGPEGPAPGQLDTANREQPAAETDRSPGAPGETLPPADVPAGPWRMVTDGDTLRLPAVARDHVDDDWLNSLPAAMPEDILQAWERTGYRVLRRRELIPMRARDGRQLAVPVDNYELRYVGNPAL